MDKWTGFDILAVVMVLILIGWQVSRATFELKGMFLMMRVAATELEKIRQILEEWSAYQKGKLREEELKQKPWLAELVQRANREEKQK